MLNVIKFNYFLISLCVGLLYIYLNEDYKHIIVLYPNPQNIDKYTYVDKANNCFNYDLNERECPKNEDEYVKISVQY